MKYPRVTIAIAIVAFLFVSTKNIQAATFTVTNANDSGAGSLRQAILDSSTNGQDDVINFDPAFFSTPRIITLTSQALEIQPDFIPPGTVKALTINGPGANLLTIDGNNIFRVMRFNQSVQATLSGVKITGGTGDGGGGPGGGIVVDSGNAFGAIANVTLNSVVVTGNHTVNPGYGGGIYNSARLTILNSTISNNTAAGFGGGISTGNALLISNSTISDNTAVLGGGMFIGASTLDDGVHATNCTIAFNRSTADAVGGGGVYLSDSGVVRAYMFLSNTIASQNISPAPQFNDIYGGQVTSYDYNIIGSGTSTPGSIQPEPHDQFSVDPRLDPNLSLNGGTMPVHALRADSTAIDTGGNCVLQTPQDGGCGFPVVVLMDERGVLRPQDGDGNGTATVDIGAFEAKPGEVSIAPTGAPDLQAASDSGVSNTDNITKNSTLTFNLSGLTTGATVELMRDGITVASGTASGTTMTLSDTNATINGAHIYAARQIIGGTTSLQGPAVTVITDNAAPTVTINQAAGQADPTKNQPINYTVTFSEQVLGFDSSDLIFTGSTANVSSVNVAVTGTGPAYNVAVSNVTVDGTVIAIVATGSVQDAAGNIGIASTSTDNTVTLDTTSPSVTINQASAQTDPVRVLPINFTVVSSEPVTGFTNADISLSQSTASVGSAVIVVTGSGTTYNVAVSNITSNGGFVQARVISAAAQDAAGNLSAASTSADNAVTLDNTSPTVTVNQAAGQADPAAALPVNFTVVFSEPVTGFDNTDISFTGSQANTTGAVVNVTGSGATYNVAVSNLNVNGAFIRVSVPSGRASDALGNLNIASGSTDNTVTIDNVGPSVTINQAAGQADPASIAPVNFTVVFNENVTGFTAAGISLASSTANVSFANIVVTGSGNIYNVSVSNITSSGSVRAVLTASAAHDALGNQSFASTSTDNTVTFNLRQHQDDFDGDGKTDLSIFRPSASVWWYLRSTDGADRVYQFGNNTDMLTPADFTGDGKTDVAFFRPSTGEWFVLRSEDNAFYAFTFGAAGDIPAPGDYDGDGKADAAVFRPSTATWFILKSSGGVGIQQFGANGDVPTVADYDGDGKTDIAIYRPSAGQWWISRSALGTLAFQFGTPTDKPVQGDYTGDGKADIAIFRPSTGEWFVLTSETFGVYAFPFGTDGDILAPGDYDGDGKTDAAIFRPSTGTWFAQGSTSGVIIRQFGSAEDKPIPAAFIP